MASKMAVIRNLYLRKSYGRLHCRGGILTAPSFHQQHTVIHYNHCEFTNRPNLLSFSRAYKGAFTLYDKDGDGSISSKELSIVLKKLGQKLTKKELAAMMREVDKDGNDKIDLQEFIDFMARHTSAEDEEEEIRASFNTFDLDGDGFINANELKSMMKRLGHDLSSKEVDEMIREADTDGDGRIDYREYREIMSRM